jgi:formylglycine-generating enzyme required for sulfatase activity
MKLINYSLFIFFLLLTVFILPQPTQHLRASETKNIEPVQPAMSSLAKTEKNNSSQILTKNSKLEIISIPKGADVYINDIKIGVTPITLKELKPGRTRVEILKTNYKPLIENIDLQAGEKTNIKAELTGISGSLFITSIPTNSDVFLDGRAIGKTPIQLSRLSLGKKKLQIQRQNYNLWYKTVEIEIDEQLEVHVDLKQKSSSLKITSIPSGARVMINGKFRGKTPFIIRNNTQSNATVKILKNGYQAWVSEKKFPMQNNTVIKARLKKIPVQQDDIWVAPHIDMEFVWVQGGSFRLGCGLWQEECQKIEKPDHEVSVKGFWLGKYEVTQAQWEKIMGDNPAKFQDRPENPVENVSWNDIQNFIKKLNKITRGVIYKLPSEKQWEYGCRSGGDLNKYCGDEGENLKLLAWYSPNSKEITNKVGRLRANSLGLHDMSGNVWEWTDNIKTVYTHKISPSQAKSSKTWRVVRGGGWENSSRECRSTARFWYRPDKKHSDLGFRLVAVRSTDK